MPRPTRTELPAKVDDWKAPWEVDADGNDIEEDAQELDRGALKKLLFGLLGDKNRLRTQVSELTEAREELEREIAEASDPKKIEDLQKKVDALQKERDDAKSGTALENLKLQIALEKGLSAKQVKRLVGSTREELEADADEILEEFGGKPKEKADDEEPGEEPEGDEPPAQLRSRPRRVSNGTRRSGEKPDDDGPIVDPDKFLEQYRAKQAAGY